MPSRETPLPQEGARERDALGRGQRRWGVDSRTDLARRGHPAGPSGWGGSTRVTVLPRDSVGELVEGDQLRISHQ